MKVKVQEKEVVAFLKEKQDEGKSKFEVIKELRGSYGTSIEPSEFAQSLTDAWGVNSYTPLEFAEMAKMYSDDPVYVAQCIKLEYPTYSAVDVGKLLLQPEIYPDLSVDKMTEALISAGFNQSEVDTAIQELYEETTMAYVLMLDTSSSMKDSLGQVKIDAKAFVALSKYKDQLGINQFNSNVSWVYPSDGNIVTVDKDLKVLDSAAKAIELNIPEATGMTNMGGALELGNEMIAQANTSIKAFVLLSDGYSNEGKNPEDVLGNEPPLFVAGLGSILDESYFTRLLAKNPHSKFYSRPSAIDMMEVFNDIRGLPNDVAVTANLTNAYNGSNFQVIETVISEEAEEAQFNVVWTDTRCQYTSENPLGYNINVILYDPTGKKTNFKPQITGPGYCVFNLYGVRPGTWKTLIQYSVPTALHGTSGGFEFNTFISLDIEAPCVHQVGKALPFTAKLLENGKPIENAIVQAKVTAPQLSVENALVKYKNELTNIHPDKSYLKSGASEDIAKLHALRMNMLDSHDILPTVKNFHLLKQNKDGHFEGFFKPEQAGAYNIEVTAKGVNPLTKKLYSRVKQYSVLVS